MHNGMPVNGNNNAAIASGVEKCDCPEMYTGDSCQDPAEGFYRWRNTTTSTSMLEDLVGKVVPCECNDRSKLCDRETGECLVRKCFINSQMLFSRAYFIFRTVSIIPAENNARLVLKAITATPTTHVNPALVLKQTKISLVAATFQNRALHVTARKDTLGHYAIDARRDSSGILKIRMDSAKVAIAMLKELFLMNATN